MPTCDDAASPREVSRHLAFAFALIALSAKFARCHDRLERNTFLAFREVFPLEDGASSTLRALFRLAWGDTTPPAYYAEQVRELYPDRPDLWREFLLRLIRIGQADGKLTEAELDLLREVAKAFGISRRRLHRMIAEDGANADPFSLLGLPPTAKAEALYARYRELMRRYHPDHAFSRLHYPEARAVAEHKAATIAAAYGRLKKELQL